ncbi:hypothetical protein SERLA73DRAFT_180024 [Serpula lacrymans var. lacrymans S7.3]|uniref:Uncharacterized protein n=2 Tax=Serpula lacrymans var. lacrymans TaxID=341189 RepID=F8PVJ3_SERL3|nr:uncharacterized protein SERLADRAFT_465439 [Serpula lacrymans var. lacrymans S7.9]EGN99810.1 hypothetical protein SERLA73DRAFT_180024 [Serpula lacrymans var. lacrymans S7.3]EGO25380.1 hypothetical protein SERLADRAFT_465439 [Serpula lacrymans var. lacrymans S7.9]
MHSLLSTQHSVSLLLPGWRCMARCNALSAPLISILQTRKRTTHPAADDRPTYMSTWYYLGVLRATFVKAYTILIKHRAPNTDTPIYDPLPSLPKKPLASYRHRRAGVAHPPVAGRSTHAQ